MLAGHVLVFWALVQLNLLEQVVRHAAPLMVQIVSPGREPAPEPLLKGAPPRVAPPPLLPTMPVPEIELR
ncbi:MAG: energy transducer TonB, partial [Rubrivivax sp.]